MIIFIKFFNKPTTSKHFSLKIIINISNIYFFNILNFTIFPLDFKSKVILALINKKLKFLQAENELLKKPEML